MENWQCATPILYEFLPVNEKITQKVKFEPFSIGEKNEMKRYQ